MERKHNRRIPLLIFTSSLVIALGSGASVKFFPLFFKDSGLSPQRVQIIFVFSPLCIALFTLLAQKVASIVGRIRATIALQSTGALLLMLMSLLHHHNVKTPFVMIGIYLVRTALMNCSYALIESVLMSSVPSDERSRWKSLESIAAFTWTGSAVVGGILSDARGYAFAFGITAVFQLIGTWILLPLDGMVPKEEPRQNEPLQQGELPRNDLTEPLLDSDNA